MTSIFNPNTIFQRQKEVVFTFLDHEIMLLNPQTGQYYSFNKVGAYIWELLAKPTSYNELIVSLQAKFDVEKEKCETDTKKFLTLLLDKHLIEIA
ncbi:MAG TPA: PqqD family protein [Bacteroidales bacterium]|nr:PqqD family protein [Bacteroidales bacterium]